MFAVLVHFEIKTDQMQRFLPLMRDNARASLQTEPGCHQFDVCTDPDRPGQVVLYELYEDAAAFTEHLKTEHFLSFDAAVADCIASKTVSTWQEVAQ